MKSAILLAGALLYCVSPVAMAEEPDESPLHMVVMDPLAAPLSCPCVEGYAQRKYEVLAEYLTNQLHRQVTVSFGESIARGLKKGKTKTAHIIIGKDSVVRADAKQLKFKVTPVAQLSGKQGSTTQTGLLVVRSGDSAQKIEDLQGYRILYGPRECDEKFAAPRQLLSAAGIEVVAAEQAEISTACSEGACKIIDWGDTQRAAAVISSYAAPLLEGCGTINKGDLRVVAETGPVPFITAFVHGDLEKSDKRAIRQALLSVLENPELLLALESLQGFVPLSEDYRQQQQSDNDKTAPEKPTAAAADSDAPTSASPTLGWTGWRGPQRTGRVRALPTSLPELLPAVWQVPLAHAGLGGIAATQQYVVIGDRNIDNTGDEFRCYDATTGLLLWMVAYQAEGHLDYDNTPRATPLIVPAKTDSALLGDRVYLLGAFGDLTCVDLATGIVHWQKNIRQEFGTDNELVWGTCASPLMVDDKLIVSPGESGAVLAALDPATGDTLWKSTGMVGYGSFIVAKLGGRQQLVGHDRTTLGGWDPSTGQRLWTLKPPRPNDFNVPTPVVVGNRLLVTTEGNGTRLYAFDQQGKIAEQPLAQQMQLAPDMSTPVVVDHRVYCVCQQLYCLDLENHLAEVATLEDPALGDYAPIIADDKRLLILGHGGELLLVDITGPQPAITSRTHLFADSATREADLYSHPALVGTTLYVRGEKSLARFELVGR